MTFYEQESANPLVINRFPAQMDSNAETFPCHNIIICIFDNIPDSKVHGANMGPIWGRQDPGGPHVGPMNFAIWDASYL